MGASLKATAKHPARPLDQFEPAVVLQAVVATYAACVVGVSFYLVPPVSLAVAVLAMLYALPPGVFTLTAAYLWLRRTSRAWLRFGGCLVGGALGGFLWGVLLLLVTKRSDYSTPGAEAHFYLAHAVAGAVGGLIFWAFTRERMRRHAEASL